MRVMRLGPNARLSAYIFIGSHSYSPLLALPNGPGSCD